MLAVAIRVPLLPMRCSWGSPLRCAAGAAFRSLLAQTRHRRRSRAAGRAAFISTRVGPARRWQADQSRTTDVAACRQWSTAGAAVLPTVQRPLVTCPAPRRAGRTRPTVRCCSSKAALAGGAGDAPIRRQWLRWRSSVMEAHRASVMVRAGCAGGARLRPSRTDVRLRMTER